MEKILLNWINNNKKRIEGMGIKVDEIVNGKNEYAVPSTRIDFLSKNKISRITAFESRKIYIQVLDMETSDTDFIFDDYVDEGTNIEPLLWEAIDKMKE